jgi:hypothetical protein
VRYRQAVDLEREEIVEFLVGAYFETRAKGTNGGVNKGWFADYRQVVNVDCKSSQEFPVP